METNLHIVESSSLDSVSYDIVIVDSEGTEHPIARCWDYAFAEDILKTAKERYTKDCAVLTED